MTTPETDPAPLAPANEARERLRRTFDALAEGVVVQDATGHIVEFNPSACRILGLSPDELIGLSSVDPRWRAVHEDGSPFPADSHPAMVSLRSGEPCRNVIMGVHRADGSRAWISINAEPLFGEGRTVAGVVTSFFDITERKSQEMELQRARLLNERIIATSPFGICIYDDNGNCLAANPAMASNIGATVEQVLQQNYHQLGSWKRYGLYDCVVATSRDGHSRTLQAEVETSFGKHTWLEMICHPLDVGGRAGIMLLTRDMSDAKRAELALAQSEAKYRSVVEQASDGIFIADRDGRYTEVNEAGCRMLGYSRDEILAMHMEQLVDPDELRTRPLALDRVTQGEPVLSERRLRRKDGSYAELEISATILPQGQYLGLARDIAQRKAAEEALRAQAVAERANRAKSDFVSRMSHELRTPLNAILGFSELLDLDPQRRLDEVQRRQLSHVRTASRHLLNLINDLLDLSRIEAGTMTLQLDDVDARAVLLEVADEFGAAAVGSQIELTTDIPHGVRARVTADRTRLRQVMENLVSNALKYNRCGGSVQLALREAGEDVLLTVSDSGLGMTPGQLDKLFEPFNRLGRETSAVEGTGIGMAITRSLVHLMGGRIAVDSEAGRGTTFEVHLPAAGAPKSAHADGCTSSGPLAMRTDVSGRVIYVEDDRVNRLLMQEYLALRPGVELELAENGRLALDCAKQRVPDLMLIDMTLPDMSGLDVLAALRECPQTAHVPCIAVSANAMPTDIRAARAAGMDGYLTKPLSVAQLLETLDARLTELAAGTGSG